MIRLIGKEGDEFLYYWLKRFAYKKAELKDINTMSEHERYMDTLIEICKIIEVIIKKYGNIEIAIPVYQDLYRITLVEDELEVYTGMRFNLHQ